MDWLRPEVCEYKRLPEKIITRPMFPDGTGWERDLYRVEGLPEALAHVVESKFMRLVDTEVNYALQKIVRGATPPWSTKTRSAWARFILSLLFRNPETVLVTSSVKCGTYGGPA